jgi:quercetin dioxygenase-like cupin family protein
MMTRRRLLAAFPTLAALLAVAAKAGARPIERTNMTGHISRNGSRPSVKGPAECFTGSVRVDPLFQVPEPGRVTGGLVTFEPGARSNWHTHPCGQTLIVVSGFGWTQCWGEARQEVGPGDVIWCPPGHKHWHGATATTAMSHIAVQEHLGDGKVVDWLEPVTDEQYLQKE